MEIKEQMFRLGSRAGVLSTLFACNSIESTDLQVEFKMSDIPTVIDKKTGLSTGVHEVVSVREAV